MFFHNHHWEELYFSFKRREVLRKPNDKETLLCSFYSKHFKDNPKFFVHIFFGFIHNNFGCDFCCSKVMTLPKVIITISLLKLPFFQ